MSISNERIVGRIFNVVDLDEATTAILSGIAIETGYGAQIVRRMGLEGADAEAMHNRWIDTPGDGVGSAWRGGDGRWRLGVPCGGGITSLNFVDNRRLLDWSGYSHQSREHFEHIARSFCDGLPSQVAEHPDLGSFAHWTVAHALGKEAMIVGERPVHVASARHAAIPLPVLADFDDDLSLEHLFGG